VAGKWSCDPTRGLPNGDNTLVVTETDLSGNKISSDPVHIKVDTTKPKITNPASGSTVVTDKPKLEGTAPGDDGTKVTVKDENNNPVCVTTVVGGRWSCVPDVPLTPGDHTLTVTVTDDSGNQSTGDPVTVKVNATPPVIKTPVDRTVTNNPQLTIGGSANVAGDSVTVYTTTAPSYVICVATVTAALTWSCQPGQPLADGVYTIAAAETDTSGNYSAPSNVVMFKIKTHAPSAPKVDPSNGTKFSGESDDGTTIDVVGPNGPIPGCVNVPVVDGKWSCVPSTPVAPGVTVAVTATDEVGNKSAPTYVTTHALTITIKYPRVKAGDTQEIRGGYFNPGEQVTCTINSDPVVIGTATVGADGTVVFTFKIDGKKLSVGVHTATLTGAQSGSVSDKFEVTAANGSDNGGWQTGGSLYTVLPIGLLAAALVVAGWAGLVVARRRQQAA